jgi:hypothetical protein
MKVKSLTHAEFVQLADDCGIRILKRLSFDMQKGKFVFDDYEIDGDLVALRQFAEEIARLERHDV